MKSRTLRVRFEPEEYNRLARSASLSGYKTISAWARAALKAVSSSTADDRKLPPVIILDRRTVARILGELKIQGSNINQCARALNSISKHITYVAKRDGWDSQTSSIIDANLRELPFLLKEAKAEISRLEATVRDLHSKTLAAVDEPLAREASDA